MEQNGSKFIRIGTLWIVRHLCYPPQPCYAVSQKSAALCLRDEISAHDEASTFVTICAESLKRPTFPHVVPAIYVRQPRPYARITCFERSQFEHSVDADGVFQILKIILVRFV